MNDFNPREINATRQRPSQRDCLAFIPYRFKLTPPFQQQGEQHGKSMQLCEFNKSKLHCFGWRTFPFEISVYTEVIFFLLMHVFVFWDMLIIHSTSSFCITYIMPPETKEKGIKRLCSQSYLIIKKTSMFILQRNNSVTAFFLESQPYRLLVICYRSFQQDDHQNFLNNLDTITSGFPPFILRLMKDA